MPEHTDAQRAPSGHIRTTRATQPSGMELQAKCKKSHADRNQWLTEKGWQTLATVPTTHGHPCLRGKSPTPHRRGGSTSSQRAQEGQRRQRAPVKEEGAQQHQSSLAVANHTHRGEGLAVETPEPQRDEESHQTWMGTGQLPEGHSSHTRESPDFDHHPYPISAS